MLERAAKKLLPSSLQRPAKKIYRALRTRKSSARNIYRALRTRKARVRQHAQLLRQRILNHVRGKRQTHLVICGCSRSGTTLLYNMVRASASETIHLPPMEQSGLKTRGVTAPGIITKRPLDIFHVDEISAEFSGIRDMLYLVSLRDPRDLVSSRHSSVKEQSFQGADYQFFIAPPVKSFTNPGIAHVAEAVNQAKKAGHRTATSRYEDLTANPDATKEMIEFSTGFEMNESFTRFHEKDVPSQLSRALNGVRPVQFNQRPAWTNPDRLERALRQIRLFPQLEEVAAAWGYEPFEEVCTRYGLEPDEPSMPRGTIVAFHTDDAMYRAEAERFARRLDALGLPYDITIVPPRDQWVENCAMKAEFLQDVRKRLRGPLLYLDVDSYVHADPWPYLSQYDGDAAAYVHRDGELMAACILLNDTAGAAWILKEWGERQKQNPLEWDQRVLQAIVLEQEANPEAQGVSFQRLPPNLCYIFDKHYPFLSGEVLIEQLQVSREIKSPDGAKTHGRRSRIKELWA